MGKLIDHIITAIRWQMSKEDWVVLAICIILVIIVSVLIGRGGVQ